MYHGPVMRMKKRIHKLEPDGPTTKPKWDSNNQIHCFMLNPTEIARKIQNASAVLANIFSVFWIRFPSFPIKPWIWLFQFNSMWKSVMNTESGNNVDVCGLWIIIICLVPFALEIQEFWLNFAFWIFRWMACHIFGKKMGEVGGQSKRNKRAFCSISWYVYVCIFIAGAHGFLRTFFYISYRKKCLLVLLTLAECTFMLAIARTHRCTNNGRKKACGSWRGVYLCIRVLLQKLIALIALQKRTGPSLCYGQWNKH